MSFPPLCVTIRKQERKNGKNLGYPFLLKNKGISKALGMRAQINLFFSAN